MSSSPLRSVRKQKMFFLLLVCIVGFSTSASAFLVPGQDKTVRVRANDSQLSVDLIPVKNSFLVNEKIRLRSKGNKPYYLYLFNVNPQTGRAVMVLPNKLQRNNYYGQQGYIVPNRDVEFFSDHAGEEQMIMVASNKSLNVDFDSYKSIGNFISGESVAFEKSLGIRFNAPEQEKNNPDIVVKAFKINVTDTIQTSQPSFFNRLFGGKSGAVDDNDPVTFISTARNEYNAGDQFNLVFGANQKGYVHLYAIDPYGAYDLLKVVAVNGEEIQTLRVQAAIPYGRHTLAALFDEKSEVNYKRLEDINLDMEKSLYVINQSKRALAIHPIIINNPNVK